MLDYSKWKDNNEIKITNLKLDAYNPRLPENSLELQQNDLINNLIENYDVYKDIAKSIAKKGYYPLKKIIVIGNESEANKYIVIEGNRRVAAIKALHNPDIVDEKNRKKFKILSDNMDLSKIKTIPAIIAPSREAVIPILFAEHALNPIKKWSTIMKAEFYANELRGGKPIAELADECDLTIGEIRAALKLHNMYEIACNLDLEDSEDAAVKDKNNFPGTTLERIYDSKFARDKLKINFDEEGNLIGHTDKEEFVAAYTKIIKDIIAGPQADGIDSRLLNSDDQKRRYFDKIKDYLPKSRGRFTKESILNKPSKEDEDDAKSKQQKPIKPRSNKTPTGLIPYGIAFKLNSGSNIKKIYIALRKISVKTYPVPSAILLRVLLDKTLRYFLKRRAIIQIEIKEDGIEKSVEIDTATLKQILEYITNKKSPFQIDRAIIKTLIKYQNGNGVASLSALNNCVHNEEYTLSEPEVRENWDNLQGLFRLLLDEDNWPQ